MTPELVRSMLRLASKDAKYRHRMISVLRKKAFRGLQPYDELELPAAQLKVHRGMDGLRVQDMSNAGKRGKVAPNFWLSWETSHPDPVIVTGIIEPILDANNYAQALQIAQGLVQDIKGESWPTMKDPNDWGQNTFPILKLNEGSVRGIDLAPLGAVVKGDTPFFTYTSTPREFRIYMKKPARGDQMGGWSKSPSHAKKIFEWLKVDGNAAKMQNITFTKAVTLIKDEVGLYIDYH